MCLIFDRGRPRCDVEAKDIEYLRNLRFSYVQIAKLLGISRATLYRRMEEEGLSQCSYTDITDSTLDRVIVGIKQQHPTYG